MFAPLLVQHSVTLTYPRQTGIRRRVNEVEDVLTKAFPTGYSFPQIVPVPEEIDPEVPRLLFGSSHGFNQILVSQIAVMLSVTYSPDWQETPGRGVQYAKERLPVLHDIVGVVAPGARPAFTGISTTLRIPSASNEASIRSVAGLFARDVYEGEVNELAVRWSKNVRRDYFCNLNVQTVSQCRRGRRPGWRRRRRWDRR